MNLTEFAKEFNAKNPDPCWKSIEHEMMSWAREVESQGGHHGLGNLNEPCKLKVGQECPACGKRGGY